MTLGNIKAAVGVVRTIREDWPLRSVEGQVTELADNYSHPDVLYVCVAIAEDRNNQFAATLTLKASKILERLHEKTATVRTRTSGGGSDQNYLCDVCTKPQRDCQTAMTNLDGVDHAFKSMRRAETERVAERAANNPIRVEAKAEVSKHWRPPTKGTPGGWSNVGQLPADVTNPTHPEPQQEEEAS